MITCNKTVAAALALVLSTLGAGAAYAGPTDVRDVDLAARNPYSMWTTTLTNSAGQTVGTVPVGYRYVIEFVSASCSASGGVVPQVLRLNEHYLAPTILAGGTVAVVTHRTRIYVDPKATVGVSIFPTTASATIHCNVSISGHLVSLP